MCVYFLYTVYIIYVAILLQGCVDEPVLGLVVCSGNTHTHTYTHTHTHTQVVWFVVQESFHHMLLPMLKWEQEGVPASCSVQFPPHNYTSRQCTALEMVLENVKVGEWSVYNFTGPLPFCLLVILVSVFPFASQRRFALK